jgi:hypothetical protein
MLMGREKKRCSNVVWEGSTLAYICVCIYWNNRLICCNKSHTIGQF